MSGEGPRAGYLPTLDGWRAVAILAVMTTHATHALYAPGGAMPHDGWFAATRFGAKGVDLFFGISGFLITARLLEEHAMRGRISLAGFYIRRFCRILPPYFAFLAVLAALAGAGILGVGARELVASVFFARNYLADDGWYTGHLWSLAVEEHFYLLWPALLVWWTPARARWRVLLFALALAAWRVAEFRLHLLDAALPGAPFYGRTDVRLDALLWGCFAALAFHDPALRGRLASLLRPATWLSLTAATVAVIVLEPPLALLWQSALIPGLLLGTILWPGGAAGRVLESAPLRWIGRISYSLYLWQQFFFLPLGEPRALGGVQSLPANLVLVFVVAWASYRYIERPMIRFGHRLATPVTPGRAA